jgi:peptide/nickel transport system substrate-binding protein
MKNKLLFVVMIVAVLVLAACGNQPTPASTNNGGPATTSANTPAMSSGTPVSKDILLDPALASDADSLSVIGYVYETLVKTQDNAPVPGLAASVTASEDGLAYTFNLRAGAKFHDGSPVNADAVIANFNRWFDPQDALHGSGAYDAWVAAFKGFKGEVDESGKAKSGFDGAEKVDETTVILHLNQPDSDFLTKLTDPAFSIVSPAALAAAGFGTQSGQDGGTGPYQISAWSDSGLTLSPFAGYWNPSAAASGNMEFSLSK